MVNKAQEAFNYFNTQQCRNCVKLTGSEYTDLTNEKKKEVQKLFDCQLTVDEIKTLLHVYKRYCADRNVPFVSDSDIVFKLNKQKEMWEEE